MNLCSHCAKGCDGRGEHNKNGCAAATDNGEHCQCTTPHKPRIEEFSGDIYLWKKISNAGEMKTKAKRLLDEWVVKSRGIQQLFDVAQSLETRSENLRATDERTASALKVRARQVRHIADEWAIMDAKFKALRQSVEDYLNTGVEE